MSMNLIYFVAGAGVGFGGCCLFWGAVNEYSWRQIAAVKKENQELREIAFRHEIQEIRP